ncbi:hemerythrin domain-containing protein [Aquihabitans sp. McL0605]|uniref:hemerythrin domain-containing protein n=1 Tax=Aquihabitans sp. McL0605 TaxID=3415671 RepID=UPI003CF86084
MDTTSTLTTTPDLTFFFAVHRHMRADLVRYVATVEALTPADRARRIPALKRWVKGFTFELEEHHYVEDAVFFPELRTRIPAVGPIIDRLGTDHKAMDDLLARWPALMAALADPKAPFEPAKAAALEMGRELNTLIHAHLEVEDDDVLPMYWRHYTADEYDALQQRAIKDGKKKGFMFVAPWSVESIDGAEREAFFAQVPAAMRLFHRLVKPRYDRLIEAAYGPSDPGA